MPRGVTVTNLLVMFKNEVGIDLSAGTADDSAITGLLSNKELWLASEYDWPFLEHRFDLNVSAGVRFIALPTTESSTGDEGATVTLNFDRPVLVQTKFNTKWQDMLYGVGFQEFNYLDSDASPPQQQDPIQRWRFATNVDETANPNLIEVWPIPATTQIVRFVGQRQILPLATGTDTTDLDGLLVVLFCAAEWLTKRDSSEAQLKGQLAQARLQRLRGIYPQRTRKLIIGGGGEPKEHKHVVPGTVIVTH